MNILSQDLSSSTLHNLIHFSLYLIFFIIFWEKTRNPNISSTPGRKYILTGGLLLLMGSISGALGAISASANTFKVQGVVEIFREVFGHIGGSLFVLVGICKWLPSIIYGQEMKTRLEKSNETLKRLWQRHQLAMSAGPAWCWELDLNTLKFTWDVQVFNTLGYKKGDIESLDDYFKIVSYPEKEEILQVVQEVKKGKIREYDSEHLYRTKDGAYIWGKVKAKVFSGNKGKPERFVGIVFDVTSLVEMQNKLEEEITLNRVMAQLAKEIISTSSIPKISELCLEAALYLSNSPYGFAGYVDPETGNLISPSFSKNVWEECKISGKELVFSKRSGLNAWVRQKGRPLLTNNAMDDGVFVDIPEGHVSINRYLSVPAKRGNRVIGQIAVANGSSDYNDKHLEFLEQLANLYALGIESILKEKELQNALVAAQAAAKAKHDFIVSVSHELRTPLNAILGFAQLLENKVDQLSPEKRSEYISFILKAGTHLSSMIEDILTIVSAEEASYNLELCNLDELIDEFIEMGNSMVREKGLYFKTEINTDISDLEIRVEPFMLKIAIRHLFSNAVKFTPEGGTLFFGVFRNSKWIEISVKDTGIGIDPKDQERIFEDFVQLKTGMKDKTPGLGLGLGLVRRIAKIHGGEIKVQSKGEGKGCKFTFLLPINKENNKTQNKIFSLD